MTPADDNLCDKNEDMERRIRKGPLHGPGACQGTRQARFCPFKVHTGSLAMVHSAGTRMQEHYHQPGLPDPVPAYGTAGHAKRLHVDRPTGFE